MFYEQHLILVTMVPRNRRGGVDGVKVVGSGGGYGRNTLDTLTDSRSFDVHSVSCPWEFRTACSTHRKPHTARRADIVCDGAHCKYRGLRGEFVLTVRLSCWSPSGQSLTVKNMNKHHYWYSKVSGD